MKDQDLTVHKDILKLQPDKYYLINNLIVKKSLKF